MLPLRSPDVRTGHADDLSALGHPIDVGPFARKVAGWDLASFPVADPARVTPGAQWTVRGGDVVSSAPELARLTLNLAQVHHDRFAGTGGRLVYGGHTIGLALAQLTRTLPDLITVAGWHGCDHTGPVREGDTLVSTIAVEHASTSVEGLRVLDLRVQVSARRDPGDDPVLDWRPVALSR